MPPTEAVLTHLSKRTDFQAILWVHQEVSPQVIKHDCVVSGVLGVLAPDDAQRLHIHEAVLLRLHGDHGATVQVEGQLVVGVGGAAQQLRRRGQRFIVFHREIYMP